MTYIRHRHRAIQESVFEDLQNTLIACRWIAGTTTRQVINPANNTLEVVTTAEGGLYPLASLGKVALIDYFPDVAKSPDINTFAIDSGMAGDAIDGEMGNSRLKEQKYIFTMAFFAESDALANSVFNDLKDRYEGRLIAPDAIPMFDYLSVSPTTVVAYLDIEMFLFTKDPQNIAPDTTQLYFGELTLTDYVD